MSGPFERESSQVRPKWSQSRPLHRPKETYLLDNFDFILDVERTSCAYWYKYDAWCNHSNNNKLSQYHPKFEFRVLIKTPSQDVNTWSCKVFVAVIYKGQVNELKPKNNIKYTLNIYERKFKIKNYLKKIKGITRVKYKKLLKGFCHEKIYLWYVVGLINWNK